MEYIYILDLLNRVILMLPALFVGIYIGKKMK
jgi:hypothetical protein